MTPAIPPPPKHLAPLDGLQYVARRNLWAGGFTPPELERADAHGLIEPRRSEGNGVCWRPSSPLGWRALVWCGGLLRTIRESQMWGWTRDTISAPPPDDVHNLLGPSPLDLDGLVAELERERAEGGA